MLSNDDNIAHAHKGIENEMCMDGNNFNLRIKLIIAHAQDTGTTPAYLLLKNGDMTTIIHNPKRVLELYN